MWTQLFLRPAAPFQMTMLSAWHLRTQTLSCQYVQSLRNNRVVCGPVPNMNHRTKITRHTEKPPERTYMRKRIPVKLQINRRQIYRADSARCLKIIASDYHMQKCLPVHGKPVCGHQCESSAKAEQNDNWTIAKKKKKNNVVHCYGAN